MTKYHGFASGTQHKRAPQPKGVTPLTERELTLVRRRAYRGVAGSQQKASQTAEDRSRLIVTLDAERSRRCWRCGAGRTSKEEDNANR